MTTTAHPLSGLSRRVRGAGCMCIAAGRAADAERQCFRARKPAFHRGSAVVIAAAAGRDLERDDQVFAPPEHL